MALLQGVVAGTGSKSVLPGSKPSFSDQIRKWISIQHEFTVIHHTALGKITHSGGGGGSAFGGTSGMSGGSGGSAWVTLLDDRYLSVLCIYSFFILKVRAGKKFLPYAVRFGKRYYQRRKYSKGMYAGMGAGAGYYAGSHMHRYGSNHYYHSKFGRKKLSA